ncbi:leukocyte cell-derived chemotaxin-2-like [Dromiciops gliroides]|uniref:leukocyte cell-derived chemotaxin-2-like n=1 Tax=Dromiciops gliroides TaxID=33562 RepID=UPI001CC3FD8A|nr:leukocyte cell-derived chemotaxin-2-like [Dromiciops gliroides]
MLSFKALLLAVLISTALAGQWNSICAGNPSNIIRTCDIHGCGHYGAYRGQNQQIRHSYLGSRGKRKHGGVDVQCTDGATVYAPFTGNILKEAKPYRKNNAINDGIQISGGGFCVKIFYIKPVKYSGSIQKGEKLGVLLPMQRVYPGIQSHVHIQNCDRSDPTRYL